MQPIKLKTNHQFNPLGIDSPQPSFSWQLGEDAGRFQQSAFELRVQTESGVVWDSGVVAQSQSHAIHYAGRGVRKPNPLLHGQCAFATRTRTGRIGVSLRPLKPDCFSVTSGRGNGLAKHLARRAKRCPRPPFVRGLRPKPSAVKRARLYATAGGLYEVFINGERVGEDVLAPGWSNYDKRRQVIAYDVTSLLESGENAIGAIAR